MCRKCGLPGGSSPESYCPRYYWLFGQRNNISSGLVVEYVLAFFVPPLQIISTALLIHGRLIGGYSRPETGTRPTYPYDHDQLDPAFDQNGRGFYALPASDQNAKNIALQKYNQLGASIVNFAFATLGLSLLSWALHIHLQFTKAGASFWDRGYGIKLRIVACALLSAFHAGISVTLYIHVQTLSSSVQSNLDITQYLNEVRARLPDGDLDPFEVEIRPLLVETTIILITSIFQGLIRLTELLIKRILHNRYRFPAGVVSEVTRVVEDMTYSRLESQGSSGGLENLYKRQDTNFTLQLQRFARAS